MFEDIERKKKENPGILGEAYFVGRRALLAWVNELLDEEYTKVEQMASGVAYCQILDAIFPGRVPMSKVLFKPRNDGDWVKNFRILQKVFDKENVTKPIPIMKLIKAKYQDNLEFMQWMKNFFDVRHSGEPYDAAGRKRAALKKQKSGKSSAPPSPFKSRSLARKKESKSQNGTPKKTSSSRTPPRSASGSRRPNSGSTRPTSGTKRSTGKSARARSHEGSINLLKQKIEEMTVQLEDQNEHIEVLEKERMFYYGKLREIEELLQSDEELEKQNILDILYRTDEEGTFETPVDDELEAEEEPIDSEEAREQHKEGSAEEVEEY